MAFVQPASVMEDLPDPVVVVASDTTLLWGNRAAEERYGAPLAELLGTSLAGLIHRDDLDTALLSMVSVHNKEIGTPLEFRIQDATGEYSWFELRGRSWTDGPADSVVLVFREITDRRRWEITQGDAAMLGAVVEHLPVVAMVLEPDGTVRGANRALTRALHIDLENVRGRPLTDLLAPGDVARVLGVLRASASSSGTRQLEASLVRADGTLVPVSLDVVNLLDDRAVQGLLVTASDITALATARRELHRRATTDDLTGLPNRGSLRLHLETVLGRGDPRHTVLFADVNDLKLTNDRFGHWAGDASLCAVAQRLQALCGPDDLVARLGGDEFVIVAATDDETEVEALVDAIDRAMHEPVVLLDGRTIPVSISVGVAGAGERVTSDDVLAAADAAMYAAKRRRPR